jgi:type IV pilus assembly protein PilC
VTIQLETKVFAYEAQTIEGQRFKGTLEAQSPEDVQLRLGELQLRVMAVEAAPAATGKARAGGRLGADEFLIFNQQLAHLTEAGLPVERGLRLIAVALHSGRLARAAEGVAKDLEAGVPLEQAFSRHAAQFPPLYGKLVEAGVQVGNLPGMLFNLGKNLELIGRLRRSLWRTLAYPVMVLAALSLVLLFIAVYVLPRFEDMYNGFRMTMPALTTFMIQVAHVYPWIFAVGWGITLALLLSDATLRIAAGHGISWVSILSQVPYVGRILRANLLARWVDSLRLGIEAGLDLPRAITLAAEATGEKTLIADAHTLSDTISRGQPLSGYSGRIIPATVASAMELAANAGDLPSALRSLSHMYEEQSEHGLRLLPPVLAPMLLIILAGAISLTIGAMILPLVKLIQSVSGGASGD